MNQPIKIFLPVTRWYDWSTVAGHNDLPTVGMPTQNQAYAAVANSLHEVRVMRQKENSIVLGRIPQGCFEILTIGPEVADTTNLQPGIAPLNSGAAII